MATIDTAMRALHLLFAGLWAGGVVFVTVGLLPAARAGDIGPDPLAAAIARLSTLSRVSAVVLLLTGGYLAGEAYTGASLLSTTRGNLVVAMVVLWIALAALVEIGSSRMRDGLDREKVRSPAERAVRFYRAASVVGIALLLVGGVLSG